MLIEIRTSSSVKMKRKALMMSFPELKRKAQEILKYMVFNKNS